MLALKKAMMSTLMEDDFKRWADSHKTALIPDIIRGNATISEAT